MKTLYYTTEKQLQDIDGIEETTGIKDISLYDIVDNKPILVIEIQVTNDCNTLQELEYFVEETLMGDDFETHLNKEETFDFVSL